MVKMESSQNYEVHHQGLPITVSKLQSVVISVAPINRIGYRILPNNQQFNCIGIGISMTDKQILVVHMRIHTLFKLCTAGCTVWLHG